MKIGTARLAALAGLAIWAVAAAYAFAPPSTALEERASEFLAVLDTPRYKQSALAFDEPSRIDWDYVPRERVGLHLRDMDDAQRRAAHAMLREALSPAGYQTVCAIIDLEDDLRAIEGARGGGAEWRDPLLYAFTLYGDPSGAIKPVVPGAPAAWQLRVEGHHLSLNLVRHQAATIGTTPLFLGANPAEVPSGPRAGFRALALPMDRAVKIVDGLDDKAKTKARLAEKALPEVVFRPGVAVQPGFATDDQRGQPLDEEGLSVLDAKPPVRQAVADLILFALQTVNDPGENAAVPISTVGRIQFAGSTAPGEGLYLRIRAGTLVIEYVNVQNDANHVHFLVRDAKDDFGARRIIEHWKQDAKR